MSDFDTAMNGYFLAACEVYSEHCDRHGYTPSADFRVTVGKKYIKVIAGSGVHSFVCKETGNIYKAASFAAPAKHARGSIYAEDFGRSCLGPYGPFYLR